MTLALAALLVLAILPSISSADGPYRLQQALKTADYHFRHGSETRDNEARARREFQAAALAFEDVLAITRERSGILRMRGAAWLLAGDVPRAIQILHRVLEIDPYDEQARRMLEHARTRVAYITDEERAACTPPPESLGWLRRWLRQWAIPTSVFASILAWATLARWVVTRRPRWLVGFAAGLALTLGLSTAWLVERHLRHEANAAPVAILFRAEILRRGDGPSYMPRRESPLPAGVEVRIIAHRDSWHQVELADGTVGWLPVSAFAR